MRALNDVHLLSPYPKPQLWRDYHLTFAQPRLLFLSTHVKKHVKLSIAPKTATVRQAAALPLTAARQSLRRTAYIR